jgi:hypothetical protein
VNGFVWKLDNSNLGREKPPPWQPKALTQILEGNGGGNHWRKDEFLPNPKCLLQPCGLMGAAQTGKRSNAMALTITEGITKRMVAISCEEDLNLSPGFVHINAPPESGRCDCCGRHLSELKPFSLLGHPSGMYIEGALLVKNYRPSAPYDERVVRILKEFFGGRLSDEEEEKAWERLVEVYGHELAEYLLSYDCEASQVGSSWECRECVELDTEAYLKVRCDRLSQESGGHIQNPVDCNPMSHEEMMQRIAALHGTNNQ